MKDIELVVFDLDGTLIDSRAEIVQAVNAVLTKIGLGPKENKQISVYIGKGEEFLLRSVLGREHQDKYQDMQEAFNIYRRTIPDRSPLYPGVKEILEYLANKKKAILTNRRHEFALATLKRLGIDQLFVQIVGGDDINCLKPSACPLDKIVQSLAVDRERALMVGDMDLDILAGKEAGVWTCAITHGLGKREDIQRANPDYIIDHILHLKDIVNNS